MSLLPITAWLAAAAAPTCLQRLCWSIDCCRCSPHRFAIHSRPWNADIMVKLAKACCALSSHWLHGHDDAEDFLAGMQKMTRMEWVAIRAALGKPRRLSLAFLHEVLPKPMLQSFIALIICSRQA